MRVGLFTTVIAVLFAGSAQAEIYTCKNAKGETIYTDSPSQCVNAEEVQIDSLPTLIPTKPVSIPASNSGINKADEGKNLYSELVITSPANDATLRDNQGNLTINFRSSPALQTRKGHKYVVTVNGKDVYSGTSTITALKNVDRGTHTITAEIIDSSGKAVISSSPVKTTLHRFSAREQINLPGLDGLPTSDGGPGVGQFNFPQNNQLPRVPPSPPPTAPPPASN